jgi:hypothetical protein
MQQQLLGALKAKALSCSMKTTAHRVQDKQTLHKQDGDKTCYMRI